MDASAADLAALQGRWEQVSLEADGIADPPDPYSGPGVVLTIRGHAFHVHHPGGETLLHGVFELNAASVPKAVTWIDAIGDDAGKPLPASYELEQDRFVFIAADAGGPRPMVFRTRMGLTMREFRRLG